MMPQERNFTEDVKEFNERFYHSIKRQKLQKKIEYFYLPYLQEEGVKDPNNKQHIDYYWQRLHPRNHIKFKLEKPKHEWDQDLGLFWDEIWLQHILLPAQEMVKKGIVPEDKEPVVTSNKKENK